MQGMNKSLTVIIKKRRMQKNTQANEQFLEDARISPHPKKYEAKKKDAVDSGKTREA
jgi:hypothetical protein